MEKLTCSSLYILGISKKAVPVSLWICSLLVQSCYFLEHVGPGPKVLCVASNSVSGNLHIC